jgi:uridine kinase
MKLTDKKKSSTHRVLIYGEPKSGKTELAARLASQYNILFFDLENGYETLLKFPHEWQERVEIVSIPDTKVFPIAIETMLKVVTGNRVEICEAHGKVQCALCKKAGDPVSAVELNALTDDWIVIVDSLTQLSNSAMNHLTKGQDDTYRPEWTDYRNQGQLLDKFLSQVQQAKYNIVCITHVVETELEDGRKKLVPVCGTTAFSRNTAKYFDHVVYCEVKNRKHNFASSTTYANNILTGSRTDVVLEAGTVPTLLDIFKEQLVPAVASSGAPASVIVEESGDKSPAQTAIGNLRNSLLRK